jgi:hypothetical protein
VIVICQGDFYQVDKGLGDIFSGQDEKGRGPEAGYEPGRCFYIKYIFSFKYRV